MLDLKSFIEESEKLGEVDRIGIVVEKEYGVSRLLKERGEDKILIYSVSGSENTVVSNILSSRARIYRALGVSREDDAYKHLLKAAAEPRQLIIEDFEQNFRRVDASLSSLPFTKFYEKDGGYYATSSVFVACWNNVCNSSFHRMMLLDSYSAAVRLVPRHLYRMHRESIEAGKELPVAVFFSSNPVAQIASAMSVDYGVFELEIASALMGGLRAVKTPIYGLPVPADAGVVAEGVLTSENSWEGPFVDIMGNYDRRRKQPVFRLKALYYNKDEDYYHIIFPGGGEHRNLMGFPREATIWSAVSKVVPRVHAVRLTKGGGGWLHAVVSITKNHEGDGKNAIIAAFAAHPSLKHVVVVDEDIDVDDPYSIEWAIATRFQADRDLILIREARGSTLDPSSSDGVTSKMGLDATKPLNASEIFERARVPGEQHVSNE